MSGSRKPVHSHAAARRRGRVFSGVLHAALLLLAVFGLPWFLSRPPLEEPAVITVELLPITGITNVKPADTPPAEEEKPEEKKPEPKKPSPPVKTEEKAPPPPEPVAEKPEEKKPEPKPEPKKPEKKSAPKDDLTAILKAVKDTAQKHNKEQPKEPKKEESSPSKSLSNKYDPGLPMSLSEKDAIMSQIARCWNVPAGARDAQNLVVVLNAEYNSDGSYIKVELAAESRVRYAADSFFRAAAESAIRAVKECSPLQALPPDKYQTWRSMELRFDPKYMLE